MEDHGGDRDRALAEFQRSSRRVLPEQRKQSQIWSHLHPERRYLEQFLLIFTVLPKGSEGSRRTPCGGSASPRSQMYLGTLLPSAGLSAKLCFFPSSRVSLRRRSRFGVQGDIAAIGIEARDCGRNHAVKLRGITRETKQTRSLVPEKQGRRKKLKSTPARVFKIYCAHR